MFSIVIPLYNKSTYIGKCMRSVLEQTNREFEVIVVNDGSTDDSLDRVRSFTDERIRIIDQENAGVSVARNNGVTNARYDHVAFLDADDWWDVNFLEEMKGLVERYPGAGIYGTRFFIRKNGEDRRANVGLEPGFTEGSIDYFRVYARTFCTPFNCSFVVVSKQAFLSENGFAPGLKFGEDFDLWVRIALRFKVAYVNKPLAWSNQDVPAANRALGESKLYAKENHFIFNMSYVADQEKQLPELKKLLDGLRVRSLFRYYLQGVYPDEVNALLAKVDFSRQPVFYRLVYGLPLPLIKIYYSLRKRCSQIKQSIIRSFLMKKNK